MYRQTMNDTQKLHILSSSAKFYAGQPLVPAYNFSATMTTIYSTYRLGAVVFLNFWAIKNMVPTFRPMSIIAKQLHASRYHLVWKSVLAQETLC